jgi:hypothetical protein
MIKHVICVGVMINVNINFVTKVEVKHLRGSPRCKSDDNVIINLKTLFFIPSITKKLSYTTEGTSLQIK